MKKQLLSLDQFESMNEETLLMSTYGGVLAPIGSTDHDTSHDHDTSNNHDTSTNYDSSSNNDN